jgi:hypothetical protein
LNATNEKWKNWRMYDYVVKELPEVLSGNFEQLNMSCASIFGHSMGGHGALTIYLKNTDKYKVLFIKTSVIWKSPSKKLFPIRKLVGVDFIYNLYSLIIIQSNLTWPFEHIYICSQCLHLLQLLTQ